MGDIKKTVIKETNSEVAIEVEADTISDFLDYEVQTRIEELDDVGAFGPNQQQPFIKNKQNIFIYIVLALCVIGHIWARATIGL